MDVQLIKGIVEHWIRNKSLILQYKLRKIVGRYLARKITQAIEHLLLH